jgi:hypothetical protein
MSAKYSQGPWRVDTARSKRGTYAYISSVNGNWYQFAKVVVKLDYEPTESSMGLANARLIAAAPDMLDALVQWRNAERDGSDNELRNARISRDLVIDQALSDAVV